MRVFWAGLPAATACAAKVSRMAALSRRVMLCRWVELLGRTGPSAKAGGRQMGCVRTPPSGRIAGPSPYGPGLERFLQLKDDGPDSSKRPVAVSLQRIRSGTRNFSLGSQTMCNAHARRQKPWRLCGNFKASCAWGRKLTQAERHERCMLPGPGGTVTTCQQAYVII